MIRLLKSLGLSLIFLLLMLTIVGCNNLAPASVTASPPVPTQTPLQPTEQTTLVTSQLPSLELPTSTPTFTPTMSLTSASSTTYTSTATTPTSTSPTNSVTIIPALTSSPTTTLTPTAPTPTHTPTETPTPQSSGLIDGDWISNEKNSGLVSGPILKFTVKNGQIVSLTVSAFPVPSEYFMWFIDKPLDIMENKFTCATSSLPASSGQGKFVLEGNFIAKDRSEGTMKFPKGFFWVDFALDHDVAFKWAAQPK
jgi:hypothetical protein